MKLRSLVFWPHLAAGVVAGLIILLMSATGVVLTYERQIVEWAEQRYAVDDGGRQPLTADELVAIAEREAPGERPIELRFVNRPGSPVTVWAGSDWGYLVDPYTGEILREAIGTTGEFFHFVTDLHRWLAIEGDGHEAARAVTAYSNLLFLFLIVTGIYLWLPRAWHWPILKTKIFFNPKVRTSKARDFNWHHVFSFWALLPLLLVCLTATVFYFPSMNAAVYGAFGEEVPEPRRGEPGEPPAPVDAAMSQQALLDIAVRHAEENGAADWYSIWMEASASAGAPAEFYVDRSIGHRPPFAYDLTLDGVDGSVIDVMRSEDYSPGDQARGFVRFLHTGETFGFAGQTVAGLASLAACLLVWTGLALAWRRLIQPLFRRP